MEALLGFEIDIWDYLTFLTLMVCVVALIMTWLLSLIHISEPTRPY